MIHKPTPKIRERKPLKGRPHVIPDSLRFEVYVRDSYTCQWCLQPGGRVDPHHRLRRSAGGKDDLRTLISCHRICHSYIHDHPEEARRRGFLVRSEDEL